MTIYISIDPFSFLKKKQTKKKQIKQVYFNYYSFN